MRDLLDSKAGKFLTRNIIRRETIIERDTIDWLVEHSRQISSSRIEFISSCNVLAAHITSRVEFFSSRLLGLGIRIYLFLSCVSIDIVSLLYIDVVLRDIIDSITLVFNKFNRIHCTLSQNLILFSTLSNEYQW